MLRSLLRSTALVFLVSLLALPAFSQIKDDDFADIHAREAAAKLTASYSITKTGFGSADRVIDPGAMYLFKVEGLLSRTVLDHMTPTNVIENGKLLPPAKGFIASFGASGDVQQINPGDRYYLHAIEVQDGAVVFTFLSVNTSPVVYKGNSSRSRLRMYLKFQFPKSKEEHSTPTAEAVHAIADTIFMQAPDKDAVPTLAPGQSEAEVRAVLGNPESSYSFGPKKILVYKDVKVTLVDNKATDIN